MEWRYERCQRDDEDSAGGTHSGEILEANGQLFIGE